MIFRLLVQPFGGIWKLKDLCNTKQGNLLTKLYRFIYNAYQFEHGSAISYKASFTSTPNLPFGTKQIIISDDVSIGKNCVIFQQVSIQSDTLPHSPFLGTPLIGDNCYIYPGVKIIGNVKIGDNVCLGPNVVITEDIASNSFVQNESPIISPLNNNQSNKYYAYLANSWKYFENNASYIVKDDHIRQILETKFKK